MQAGLPHSHDSVAPVGAAVRLGMKGRPGGGRCGRRGAFAALACVLSVLALWCGGASALEAPNEWRPLLTVRFGNIDAIDAEDGHLAAFIRTIRNDGRFFPPLRTLIGPRIRNTTFFGLSFEGWMEGMVLVPTRPGPARTLWVFPVESRDEYLSHLAGLGLSEYEGMDGVTVLREMDREGNFHTWYLEWLPGNIAVFGDDREPVAAARRIYAENSASRGMLAGSGGQYVQPDVMLSLKTDTLSAWRDNDAGSYWWREKVGKLTADLLAYWRPNPARTRLANGLAADLVAWPRTMERLNLSVWFEEAGVEWRLDVAAESDEPPVYSQLELFRRLPDRTALAYGKPVTDASWKRMAERVGKLVLDAAGGAVSSEARREAFDMFAILTRAGLSQMAAAWISPPTGRPEMGAARLLVCEFGEPQYLEEVWTRLLAAAQPGTPVDQVFSQMGWRVEITVDPHEDNAAIVRILPADQTKGLPYAQGVYVARREEGRLAVAGGEGREDPVALRRIIDYRAALARNAVETHSSGSPAIRGAFLRMGQRGASFIGILDPVRFLQMAMIEAADWRPRSPDQHEPLATQLAKEMLEYSSGGTWPVVGEDVPGGRQYNGILPWRSLSRLSGALGITESIGME